MLPSAVFGGVKLVLANRVAADTKNPRGVLNRGPLGHEADLQSTREREWLTAVSHIATNYLQRRRV